MYIQVLKIHYPSDGEAGRGIVDFLDFFIDIFLEVHNQKYNEKRYLIEYNARGPSHGVHFCIKSNNFIENLT